MPDLKFCGTVPNVLVGRPFLCPAVVREDPSSPPWVGFRKSEKPGEKNSSAKACSGGVEYRRQSAGVDAMMAEELTGPRGGERETFEVGRDDFLQFPLYYLNGD